MIHDSSLGIMVDFLIVGGGRIHSSHVVKDLGDCVIYAAAFSLVGESMEQEAAGSGQLLG